MLSVPYPSGTSLANKEPTMSSSFDGDEEATLSTAGGPEKVCIDSFNGAVFDENDTSDHPGYLITYGFASQDDRNLYEKQHMGRLHSLLLQAPRYIGGLLRRLQRACFLPDSRPVLHMYRIHRVTGEMEIAGEIGDLSNRQYKIVTVEVNYPKSLEYGYGVIAIFPVKRWWQWWRRTDDSARALNTSEKPAQSSRQAPMFCEVMEWDLPRPNQDSVRKQFSKLAPKRVKLNKAASSSKKGGGAPQ